uniref:C-type lectin domain-containing protein n=1 Tax=Gouania willdenowi TaxID=441366 RepID=A0A8C5G683_GOUWI
MISILLTESCYLCFSGQTSSIPCMYIVLPHSLKFYFSTGWSYSTCLQYHYVADQKTWTEAQTYCRQTYADLATIGNKEQNDQLLDTITSAGQSSEVWMGLYSTIDWRWSDGFSGVGANYSNWRHGQPNFHSAHEFCVLKIGVQLIQLFTSCMIQLKF